MSNSKEKFNQDLTVLISNLTPDMDENEIQKLLKLKNELVKLQKENIVKINHSVMELVCAKHLILKGYDVQVEHKLSNILTCDLYAIKGYGSLIVEIETGYIPPEHALDPLTYTYTRLASKIIRYSNYSEKFAIGVPPHYVLPLPQILSISPKKRSKTEIEQIKNLCDYYYKKPPVTKDNIRNARIHDIYIIDVDRTKTLEMDPESYIKRALNKGVIFTLNEKDKPSKSQIDELEKPHSNLDEFIK